MQIDWQVTTCFIIGFFALAGFSRGWWREGLTTLFLTVLVVFLQRPSWAQAFIDFINNVIATIWGFVPTELFNLGNGLLPADATGAPPIQADANGAGTWMIILILFVAASVLIGRLWLQSPPTLQGGLLGTLLGAVNGFVVLNLVREYMDGRALPGSAATPPGIIVAGNTSFGQAATEVAIQVTSLPSLTLLDSNIPWIVIGSGLLISFAVLKSRFEIQTNRQNMKKLNYKKLPPFYVVPKTTKPTTSPLEDFFKRVSG